MPTSSRLGVLRLNAGRLNTASSSNPAPARVSQLALEVLQAPVSATALRVSQAAVEVLRSQAIAAQISQVVVEVLRAPAPTTLATLSQATVEILVETAVPTAAQIVATQLVLEPASRHAGTAAVTALAIEPASRQDSAVDATQVVVEYAWKHQPVAPFLRVTQLVIEYLRAPRESDGGGGTDPQPPGGCASIDYPLLPACSVTSYPVLPPGSLLDYPVLPAEACMDASTFVVNMALGEIGITKTISNLATDPSQEAYAARLIYTDVMDTVLRDFPWKFATEYAALVWQAGTPSAWVNPDWTYAYLLPSDCVRVRRVCDPAQQRRFTARAIPFDQRADAEGLRDLLLCNEPGGGQLTAPYPGVDPTLTIEYTKRLACSAQVNDAQFREAVVFKLGARLAKALARDSKDADRCLRNYLTALPKAQTQHANDAEPQRPTDEPPDWTRGR